MRNEKYDNTKPGYDTDDIKYAFENNGLSSHLENIDVIVAEVCGANDEAAWHWILKMKDGTYRYAEGSCDYTGWDCQSGASISEPMKTVNQALELSPEEASNRRIRTNLSRQVSGEQAFATFVTHPITP